MYTENNNNQHKFLINKKNLDEIKKKKCGNVTRECFVRRIAAILFKYNHMVYNTQR